MQQNMLVFWLIDLKEPFESGERLFLIIMGRSVRVNREDTRGQIFYGLMKNSIIKCVSMFDKNVVSKDNQT